MSTFALSTPPSSLFHPPSVSSHRASSIPLPISPLRPVPTRRTVAPSISCEVALKPEPSAAVSSPSDESDQARIGARVRVKVPLKVYHVPKTPELDLFNKEGVLKQYVGLWKGKQISANLPFKVEFFTEVEGRGAVKFFAHLKEDEFDYVD